MDPCIVDYSVEIPTRCSFVIEFIIPKFINMFRASHRSSSRALNCIFSLWFIYPCGDRPLSRLGSSHAVWTTAGHHMGIQIRRCKYSLELLMMSGMPLETCSAFNEFWNIKFYYKIAFCWLFILSHTTIHGSMNI
jgi:hypothetical protein